MFMRFQNVVDALNTRGVSIKRCPQGYRVDKHNAPVEQEIYITDDLEDAYHHGLRLH